MQTISCSVGNLAINHRRDVLVVQRLLNQSLVSEQPLTLDGRAGPKTIRRIKKIQADIVGMNLPDGRVDPHGRTLAKLIKFAETSGIQDTGVIAQAVGRDCPNRRSDVKQVQMLLNRHLTALGHPVAVDGVAGPRTLQAIKSFQQTVVGMHLPDEKVSPKGPTIRLLVTTGIVGHPANGNPSPSHRSKNGTNIAWGRKVSTTFKSKVINISNRLGVSADYLMSCMAFETGETFSPSIKNAAGSGAVGLIQFMPFTATSLGTTIAALSSMTAVDQLDFVEKYFSPYKGTLHTLDDVYLAILYPAAIGKSPNATLFQKGTLVYQENRGFDKNGDGIITPAEVSAKVKAKYQKGLKPAYLG